MPYSDDYLEGLFASPLLPYLDDPKLYPAVGLNVEVMAVEKHAHVIAKLESKSSLTIDTKMDNAVPVYPSHPYAYQFPRRATIGEHDTFENVEPVVLPPETQTAPRRRRNTLSRKLSTFFDFLFGDDAEGSLRKSVELEKDTNVKAEKAHEEATKIDQKRATCGKRSRSLHRRKKTREETELRLDAAPSLPSLCYSYSCGHWTETSGIKTTGPNCEAYNIERAQQAKAKGLKKTKSTSDLCYMQGTMSGSHSSRSASFDELSSDPSSYDNEDDQIDVAVFEDKEQRHNRQHSLDASLVLNPRQEQKQPPSMPMRKRASSLFSIKRKSSSSALAIKADKMTPAVPQIPSEYLQPILVVPQTELYAPRAAQAPPRIQSTLFDAFTMPSLASPVSAIFNDTGSVDAINATHTESASSQGHFILLPVTALEVHQDALQVQATAF